MQPGLPLGLRPGLRSGLLPSLILGLFLVSGVARVDAQQAEPGANNATVELFSLADSFAPVERQRFRDAIHTLASMPAVSDQDRAVLSAITWIVDFTDHTHHFESLFSDYVLMLNEFTLNPAKDTQNERVSALIRFEFERASTVLPWIFPEGPGSYWDFISVIGLLHKYDVPLAPWLTHFERLKPYAAPSNDSMSFDTALARLNYDVLGEYLIDQSFAYHARADHPDSPFALPDIHFESLLEAIVDLPFVHTLGDARDYSEQNYFVTHVPLVMTHYGEKPLVDTALSRHILRYLLQEFDTVLTEVDDLDLLGEFLHCLKFYPDAGEHQIARAVQFLLSQQNTDGSWGVTGALDASPYSRLHGTWAVATALNYPAR